MANALYELGREKFLRGEISWNNDDIKVALVDTELYTVDLAAHEFLSDIPVGARVAISPNMASKTTTNGIADAADVTFPEVVGISAEAIVIYKDSGTAASSPLILYIDTAVGLPVVPTDNDIRVTWASTTNRIFKL